MEKRFYQFIAMALLLALLPATAAAAPPQIPYVMAGAWTFSPEELPATTRLSAWDINWRVVKPAIIQLGFVQCGASHCERVVEVTIAVNSSDKYPQHLHLAGETWHRLVAGPCESSQFINLRDRDGNILVATLSPVANVCIDP